MGIKDVMGFRPLETQMETGTARAKTPTLECAWPEWKEMKLEVSGRQVGKGLESQAEECVAEGPVDTEQVLSGVGEYSWSFKIQEDMGVAL